MLDHIAKLDGVLEVRPVIIVVDNDGNDPAVERIVADFRGSSGLQAHYVIEKTPGISAARNTVFAKADELNLRFLAMLDDDEWPAPNWLNDLLAAQARSSAVVVGGPVHPVFPPDRQDLLRIARFWTVDRGEMDGRTFVFCTCNFLIDLAAIADEPRPLFEAEFGLSGGGDTVFFRKLFFKGHAMDWAPTAHLSEEVPPSRANMAWIRQRRFRVGNHMARWEALSHGKAKTFLKTLGLTLRLAIYPFLRREPEVPLMGWLMELEKVRGRYALHFGSVFVEYARNKADSKMFGKDERELLLPKARRLAREHLPSFVGALLPTLIALGLQLVTFAITARGLGVEPFGQYAVILAFAAASVELIGLGGADVMVRATAKDPADFSHYFGHMLLLIAVTYPIVVGLCFALIRGIEVLPLSSGMVVLGLASEMIVSRISASCELVMVAHHHAVRAGWLRMGTVGIRLAAAAIFFLLLQETALSGWVLIVSMQALLTTILLLATVVVLYGRPRFDLIHSETKSGLAFCANQSARAMQGNLDRVILANFADAASLGIYSAASRMLQVGLFPLQVATRFTYPHFFVKGEKGLGESRRYAIQLAPVYLLVGIGAGLAVYAAAWVLPLVIGDSYRGTAAYGILLAIGLPFMALQYPAADALTGAGFQSQRAVIYLGFTLGLGFIMALGASLYAAKGLVGGYVVGQVALAAILWGLLLLKKAKV